MKRTMIGVILTAAFTPATLHAQSAAEIETARNEI